MTVTGRNGSERYDGVPVIEVLKRAGVPTGEAIRDAEPSKYAEVTGADGYRVVFALAELGPTDSDRPALLADKRNPRRQTQ
jgi:hypothetical protein